MKITEAQKDLMKHTISGQNRNWFGTSFDCKDSKEFEQLVDAGYATKETPLNIYKIKQNANKDYDTYDSAVVIANSAQEAQQMQPEQDEQGFSPDSREFNWAAPEDVIVTYIGIAEPAFTKPCVIVSSYNAG